MFSKECAVCNTEHNLIEKHVTRENFLWFRNYSPQTELIWDETTMLCDQCQIILEQFEEGILTAQGEMIFGYCNTCQDAVHENTNMQALVFGAHNLHFYCEECFSQKILSTKHTIKL